MRFDKTWIDKAFINGSVITVDEKDTIAQAVGVKGNKIVFVGDTDELMSLVDAHTTVVDLAGKTLMPGMIDTHFHPIFSGLVGKDIDSPILDIKSVKSIKALQELYRNVLKKKKPGEWISSMGYDVFSLEERRHPTIEELDYVAPDNPVQCMQLSGHICIYNSKALEKIGVYGPEDAYKYPKDEVEVIDGKLTGLVRDNTHFLLWSKVDYSIQQQEFAAMRSQDRMLSAGVTSVHDCGALDAPSYHLMQRLCREGKFKIREYMFLHSIFGKEFSLEDNEHWLSLGLMSGLGDEHFRFGGCKFMIDGGSGAPSSACRKPYCHDPNLPGIVGWEREEVADYIKRINDAQCQATAHAMGDLAIEFMVEGYEKAFATNPRPDLRHRIEHCMVNDQDLIDRMAKMNICPTINVGMITRQGKNYMRIYGEERAKYIMPLRSMIDAGMKPSIASDSPSGPVGFAIIDGAVNRYDTKADYQFDTTQAISVLEAIRCATYNGAYSSYEEKIKGSLEVGKLADMILLDCDILSIPKEEIGKVTVESTWIDGEKVYENLKK